MPDAAMHPEERHDLSELRRAAARGEPEMRYRLGECYRRGLGIRRNRSLAVWSFRLAAEAGHIAAQYALAQCYAVGEGTEKDTAEAVKLYRAAAEQGHAAAQRELGTCYLRGEGVDIDKEEAVRMYRAAAEQGDAEAWHLLGECYFEGTGVDRAQAQAIVYFRKAADLGYSPAMFRLCMCYYYGHGTDIDVPHALKWLCDATRAGNAAALRWFPLAPRSADEPNPRLTRLPKAKTFRNHADVEEYAYACYEMCGLEGWKLGWKDLNRRQGRKRCLIGGACGKCYWRSRTIRLDIPYTDECLRSGGTATVRCTVSHEIAHAITFERYGYTVPPHGAVWGKACVELGLLDEFDQTREILRIKASMRPRRRKTAVRSRKKSPMPNPP